MLTKGPVVVIEDDEDDRFFVQDAILKCDPSSTVRFFESGLPALKYLNETAERPFIIFCDINMPMMTGLELRAHINDSSYLRRKSIPFIFLTTTDSPDQVEEAYNLTIQGFFKKPHDIEELRRIIQEVMGYWTKCLHPNMWQAKP